MAAVARPPGKAAALTRRAGFSMGGYGLEFKSDSAGIISVLNSRYGHFAAKGRCSLKFRVTEVPGRDLPFKPAVLAEGPGLEIRRGDFRAALDSSGAGELEAAPNEQCLDAFLRSLLSCLFIRAGGFMLHSAGLVRNGRAYIFLGKSGAGKSTLARLAATVAGVGVISDEINLLRPAGRGFRVYGSPFWGEMRADGRPGSWPLGGIFLLKKARSNRVRPCGKAEALKTLLRCLLNFEKSGGVSEKVLANAARLLAAADFSALEFSKKDSSFLELV